MKKRPAASDRKKGEQIEQLSRQWSLTLERKVGGKVKKKAGIFLLASENGFSSPDIH